MDHLRARRRAYDAIHGANSPPCEFPQNGQRKYLANPRNHGAWSPAQPENINNNNDGGAGRSSSATSRRDPRVHPVNDQGQLVDPERQGEERGTRTRNGNGKWFCCVCGIVITILIVISIVVVVVVLWAVTGFQFGSSAAPVTAPTTVVATATTTAIPATFDTIMATNEDVTAEIVTFDMTTMDSMVSQTGETNTWATTGETNTWATTGETNTWATTDETNTWATTDEATSTIN
eukprot:XP_011675368.1 PREDICTED: uncharacterized protein LOC105443647 [Strongylocentrotus purpuratus]